MKAIKATYRFSHKN